MASNDNLISSQQIKQYRQQGYFTVEGLFTPDEVVAVRSEITKIVARYPDGPKGLIEFEPSVESGKNTPDALELGVRKLSNVVRHNAFFRKLAFHPKMAAIATVLLGPDVVLLQSIMLLKPPRIGSAKVWHQDNAYFRRDPNHIVGFWVACDDATVENGCMHVIPGSHTQGIVEHSGFKNDYGVLGTPSFEEAVAVPLEAGDALMFHGELLHGSPPNKTDARRRSMQYHYASSKCHRTKGWELYKVTPEVHVAGRDYGYD